MQTRNDDRIPVALEGVARFVGGQALVRILDISTGGCRLITDSTVLRRGMSLLICPAQGFNLRGQIMWAREDQVGVLFNSPIQQEHIELLATGQSPDNDSFASAQSGRAMFPV